MAGDIDFFNVVFGSAVYTEPARLRADDLLVRGRAQEPLGAAAEVLRDVAVQYQRAVVPPARSGQPFPDPGLAAPMRRADQARASVVACRDAIRDLTAPGTDHIWSRHRQATPLLALLVATDQQLITCCDGVRELLSSMTVETLAAFDWARFEAALAEVRRVVEQRRQLTSLQY